MFTLKRKAAIVILIVCLLSSLTACGFRINSKDNLTENEKVNTLNDQELLEDIQELLPEKLIKVGVVQVGHESDWRVAATKACQEVFCEDNGYQMYFIDADNDPQAQITAVRNFIQTQVDYIVIAPILTTGWSAVLKEAYHVGIPVFLMDRTIDCDPKYYKAWFGSDFILEGECVGQWLQKYLHRSGRDFEQICITAINGTEGASAQLGRTTGFKKYLERNQNWKLLAEECGNFTESGGKQVMNEYLEKYPKIDVVLCQNDNEALGACMALDEAGISYGIDGDVIMISFDATRAGLEAVLKGKIHADFECNPMAPLYVSEAIQKLEAGETLTEKKCYLPEDCFTCDENLTILSIAGEMKKMIPVTRELLKERFY